MKFDVVLLADSIGDKSTVLDEITDTSRWSIHHRRVFRHEGKFYETHYSVGATEQQDESPYQYEEGTVECPEVVPVEKTITVYVPASPHSEEGGK